MNNYISLFLATLVKLEHLTKEDAEKLNEDFTQMNLPGDFDSACRVVADTFDKYAIEAKKDLQLKK